MKTQFNTKVVRSDEYQIIVDESKLPKDFLKQYARYFNPITSINDLVEHIGLLLMRFGTGKYIDGIGYLHTQTKQLIGTGARGKIYDWVDETQWNENQMITEQDYCAGITVRVVCENDTIEVEVKSEKID